MGLLFLGGVMNLLWIAAITVFVLLAKVLPFGDKGGLVLEFGADVGINRKLAGRAEPGCHGGTCPGPNHRLLFRHFPERSGQFRGQAIDCISRQIAGFSLPN